MEPQGAPAAQPPGPEAQPQPGNASKLVTSINSQLNQLMELVGGSQDVDDDDKAGLGQVIAGFQAFVDSLGNPSSKGRPQPGVQPMEAGASGAKPSQF